MPGPRFELIWSGSRDWGTAEAKLFSAWGRGGGGVGPGRWLRVALPPEVCGGQALSGPVGRSSMLEFLVLTGENELSWLFCLFLITVKYLFIKLFITLVLL